MTGMFFYSDPILFRYVEAIFQYVIGLRSIHCFVVRHGLSLSKLVWPKQEGKPNSST